MISALRLAPTKWYLSPTHSCELHLENEKTGNCGIYKEGNTMTLILVKGIT